MRTYVLAHMVVTPLPSSKDVSPIHIDDEFKETGRSINYSPAMSQELLNHCGLQ